MRSKPVVAVFAAATLAGLSSGPAQASNSHRTCGEFSELSIILEQNATDGDAEVVVFAKGQDDGLRSLTVTSPRGRLTAAFIGSSGGIGIREFILESAEPTDIESVLRSFPEGVYRFRGRTVNGECLKGSATLSHIFAPATVILTPGEDEVIAPENFVLTWEAVPGAASYVIGVDNEDRGTALVAEIAPTATAFTVPREWLEAGTEYTVAVAVKAEDGNSSSVEITVTTIDD